MPEQQDFVDKGGNMISNGVGQATEAVEKLRSVVDQASRSICDLTQATGQWAQDAQKRAGEMAKDLQAQGERAATTVAQQVETYPLTSLAIAFGVGFLVANLIRR
ncbi:MAG: hypothetical protein ACREFH_14075 [Stellaceae bacterium]|jgi:ElaB/YqjD/DUF883 family membrane-anchored ribosome-binding protein